MNRHYPISDVKYQKVINLPYGSPARFLYDYGIIQCDVNRMSALPQPVRYYIQCHELGHYFYGRPVPKIVPPGLKQYYEKQIEEDELEADRFALYHYLNQGYNFSTAFNTLYDYLSPSGMNVTRIVSLYNEIKHLHKLNEQ